MKATCAIGLRGTSVRRGSDVRRRCGARILTGLLLFAGAVPAPAADEGRLERINREFLEHLKSLGPEQALATGIVVQSWESYRRQTPESFVPDALAVLYATYRDGLVAFDEGRYRDTVRLLAPLREHADPYLAAGARYFHVRALVEQKLLEEAEAELDDARGRAPDLIRYTPYAPHLSFLRAYCQASNLRFDEATATLRALETAIPDAPEPVRVGTRQMLLELERRERGTLGEVATIMDYSAARLGAADTTQRVRARQDQVIALLDRLIADAEEREKQQQHGSSRRSRADRSSGPPRRAAEESRLPDAQPGQTGEQHTAPRAEPGEMWGRLPPTEREKILQSLRDRFPSRYRQLVEQYYRALGEQK